MRAINSDLFGGRGRNRNRCCGVSSATPRRTRSRPTFRAFPRGVVDCSSQQRSCSSGRGTSPVLQWVLPKFTSLKRCFRGGKPLMSIHLRTPVQQSCGSRRTCNGDCLLRDTRQHSVLGMFCWDGLFSPGRTTSVRWVFYSDTS